MYICNNILTGQAWWRSKLVCIPQPSQTDAKLDPDSCAPYASLKSGRACSPLQTCLLPSPSSLLLRSHWNTHTKCHEISFLHGYQSAIANADFHGHIRLLKQHYSKYPATNLCVSLQTYRIYDVSVCDQSVSCLPITIWKQFRAVGKILFSTLHKSQALSKLQQMLFNRWTELELASSQWLLLPQAQILYTQFLDDRQQPSLGRQLYYSAAADVTARFSIETALWQNCSGIALIASVFLYSSLL